MITTLKDFIKQARQRGFTLLIAVILTSVVLSIGLALLDVSYKQITLASSARQSQYAFYAADSGLECALYWDSVDQFDYATDPIGVSPTVPSNPSTLLACQGQNFSYYDAAPTGSPASRTTTYSIPCAGGGSSADITIQKFSTGDTNIYSNGYNTCTATDPRRVQRGEEAHYQ